MLKKNGLVFLAILFLSGSFGGTSIEAEDNQYVTHGEFMKQLLTAMEVDLPSEAAETFKGTDAFSSPYMEAAARLTIIKGSNEETFASHEKVTREQAYAYLIRSLNLKGPFDTNILKEFEDGHTLTWSKEELAEALRLGLLTVSKRNKIYPKQPITSAELTGMLARYKENFKRVPILHTNDVHARIMYNARKGELGYAKISKVVNEVRGANADTLLFDIGDTFHGTNLAILNKGQVVVDVMNAMNYDAMVPGNHDFNYGQNHLKILKSKARFPIISANVIKEGKTIFFPYIIKQVQGKQIAFIGLTAADTAVKTNPEGIEGLLFKDEIQTVKETVKELRGKADHIVLLSHAGSAMDERIANEVKDVDLILGGHSHKLMERPQKFKYAYVAQAFEYGKTIGRTQLIFHNNTLIGINGFLYRNHDSKTEDQKIAAVIKEYKAKTDVLLNEVVGKVSFDLDGERDHVRTKETNLGNLIADAMREAVKTDIAITNGGGIRSSVDKGNVTRDDLLTVLPFSDTLVKLSLTGKSIKLVLEHSVSVYPEEHGGFLQVSGLSFTFDPLQPAGKRVKEININGRPLNPDKIYTVAVNRFTAIGGDGYTMLKGRKITHNSGHTLSKILADYIKKDPVIPTVEGRIMLFE
ncbi:bifunctional metallophosphatase/5'-nucleotidase [Priestia abyssalis]|uniref:bifunctional metallophosphatase/5'-nucleotidase n=1 Tax=Priestia abyssalis TaxID=1221450 RepID=UPI000994E21E|nr:5'-nucleotidase C-terminal domain-containing protein [Priestia abyssalis]